MMSLVSLVDRIDHALSPYSRPLNLQFGLLCSARYTLDQRWYRAKVIDHLSNRGKVKLKFNVDGILGLTIILYLSPPFSKVKVYFLDHGNTEEVPTSSVGPLLDKYQVFPFQMLQCCFSTDPKFSFGKREVHVTS